VLSVPRFCHECGTALSREEVTRVEVKTVVAKKPRGPSAYNLEYKKQYARLQKKHPRTSFAALAKKAHKETKKVRK